MSLFADPRWSEALAHLPDYLGNHLRVSLTALALGLAISLPLAIAVRNRTLPRGVLLGLPSGQDVARAMRVKNPLTPDEIANELEHARARPRERHTAGSDQRLTVSL